MRVLAVCGVIVCSSLGCAQILGFGEGGAGGDTGGTGATGGGGTGGTGGESTGGTGGTGGPGGTGGTGGATMTGECAPGTVEPCFEAPPEIDGVGACKAGARTCSGDGLWGVCSGQVPPAVESCATTDQDESCDGLSKCTGAHRWSERFASLVAAVDVARGVVVDRQGHTIVTGETAGTLDFGQPAPSNAGGSDVFVLKLDPEGKVLWGRTFGSPAADAGEAVAVDADGNIFVVGQGGAIDFLGDGNPPAISGISDGFLAKLDPQGGVLWAHSYGGAGQERLADVAVTPDGEPVVIGSYNGPGVFGGAVLPDAGATWDMVVAKVTADGQSVVWVTPGGGAMTDQIGTSIAVGAAGELAIAADFQGNLTIAGNGYMSGGGTDMFIARLDPGGGVMWGKPFGGMDEQHVTHVRANPGGFVFAGTVVGTFGFGSGPKISADPDVALWSFTSAGVYRWDRRLISPGGQAVTGLAVDPLGYAVVAGTFDGTFDYSNGGYPLQAQTTLDRFVMKLDSGQTTKFQWQRGFAGSAGASPRVAVDPMTGRIVLADGLTGATDFGGGPLVAAPGDTDIVVAGLAP